jgi:MoxR-like ATPase
MEYKKTFFPVDEYMQNFSPPDGDEESYQGDRRDGKLYLYDEDIVLLVNVALATKRPILVFGPSGSGKSSLAHNIARVLDRKYYEFVVTSRTKSQDLLWRFDAIRRLSDAQIHSLTTKDEMPKKSYFPYIDPGVLWWIFDPESAQMRGAITHDKDDLGFPKAEDLALNDSAQAKKGSVLLIDEIDKADLDFPNNLLVPLGSNSFRVDEIGLEVKSKADAPLIIITSNGERKMPEAFIRRCVILNLDFPAEEKLLQIARKTIGEEPEQVSIYTKILSIYKNIHNLSNENDTQIPISVAEYLDAARAALALKISSNDIAFKKLIEQTIIKST